MSKELVISAASHERRVAILEEGQLVEIYIEREKEFALVGSIYKGRVTRVLPGMQCAFVDIGLDGDAFLYVSDVFENLEDYDHGHGQSDSHGAPPAQQSAPARSEALPGETIGQGDQGQGAESHEHEEHPDEQHDGQEHHEAHADAGPETHGEEHHDDEHCDDHEHDNVGNVVEPGNQLRTEARHPDGDLEPHNEFEERQPESNASAPQNFAPHYNPTQKYPQRNDRGPRDNRGGQSFSRPEGDRGNDRGGGRGGQAPAPGGRNLPPSKYAAPQGDQRGNDSRGSDSRGYNNRDNRGSQGNRGFDNRGDRGGPRYDNRRPEGAPRPPASQESSSEDEILLPGESLAEQR